MAGAPKVTFESLCCVFEFLGVSGSVGALPGHNTGVIAGKSALLAALSCTCFCQQDALWLDDPIFHASADTAASAGATVLLTARM